MGPPWRKTSLTGGGQGGGRSTLDPQWPEGLKFLIMGCVRVCFIMNIAQSIAMAMHMRMAIMRGM